MNTDIVFDRDITQEEYDRWLQQFEIDDRYIIEKLTHAFRYYSLSRINEALRRLYSAILENVDVPIERLRFIPVGYVAKSGSAIAYYFRKQNRLKEDLFLSSLNVQVLETDPDLVPVLVDDFIGSGHQSWEVIEELRNAAPGFEGRIVFAAVIGLAAGVSLLRKEPNVIPIVADMIYDGDLPFSETSKVFPTVEERQAALGLVERYGKRLYPQHPLGYARSQGLIGFFYSTPNNTFPIYWSTEEGWIPLLAHGESFRDPSYLFGPPTGLTAGLVQSGPNQPLAEIAELDELDIHEEIAVLLLGEFHKVRMLIVLAPIFKQLGITRDGTAAILAAVTKLKHLEHEQRAVRSAIIVAPVGTELVNIGNPIARAMGGVTLRHLDEVASYAELSDGLQGGIVAHANGNVLGVVTFAVSQGSPQAFLPKRYWRAAEESKRSGTFILVFSGNGRVQAFYGGKRILSFRHATWHHHISDYRRGLMKLSRSYHIALSVLEHVTNLALQLVDVGKGALITVGQHEAVLEMSDPPNTGHFQLQTMNITNAGEEMLLGLMGQDGATIISDKGVIIQGMTFLRPPPGIEAEETKGKGSKHSTAAKISKATQTIALAISIDGGITIYADGAVQLKVMG